MTPNIKGALIHLTPDINTAATEPKIKIIISKCMLELAQTTLKKILNNLKPLKDTLFKQDI